MRQSGFSVDLASDGDEAWDLATHFPYAVIATDLRMPGMDGMMLIDQLKELQPDPVCLLVTGCRQLDWYDAPAEGAPSVIKKPWNGGQLAAALQQAVEQYRRRARSVPESDPPPESVRSTVALVGFSPGQRRELEALLDGEFAVSSFESGVEAAEALPGEQPPTCALVHDDRAARTSLRALAAACSTLPLVVIGTEKDPAAAVEAVRSGAQDWVPREGLSAGSLLRAIHLSLARGRPPSSGSRGNQQPVGTGMTLERFRQAISRARRFSTQAGLLLVDLDCFADINAALGHEGGDALIRTVGQRLQSCVRESDSISRVRQDEFALILEDLDGESTIDVPAQRVLNAFATPFRHQGSEVVVTASIGGAVFPGMGDDENALLRRAEAALQQAKSEGRNRYRLLSQCPRSLVGPDPVPTVEPPIPPVDPPAQRTSA